MSRPATVRCSAIFTFVLAALLLSPLPFSAQTLASQAASARTALSTLFHDVWEDELKRSPELASTLGDRRYNDQLSLLSPRAVNDALARRRTFLNRLIQIDTTSLSEQEKLSAELLQRQLIEDEEAARFKAWEMPINQLHGVQTDLASMVVDLPFDTVKDYDDYIARLHKIPAQLRQASENLLAGIDDGRIQPASVLEAGLKQTEELANQPAADSPFTLPLKKFPATVDAASRKRISAAMLDAIQDDVLPAYVRFAKFLRVTELPAARDKPALQPGPISAHDLREIKILELRGKAQSALGSRFDLNAFRNVMENAVALPVDMLEQRVDAWIVTAKQ